MIEQLPHPTVADIEALTRLWEASVRATHHFLQEKDIAFYRPLAEKGIATVEKLYVTQDASGFTAFMGIESDKIEMLFVDPRHRGRQLGRRMVEYAVEKCGVRKVDVNEQNTQAVGFYHHMQFRPVSRDHADPAGKLYPILHMEIESRHPDAIPRFSNRQVNRTENDFLKESTAEEIENK